MAHDDACIATTEYKKFWARLGEKFTWLSHRSPLLAMNPKKKIPRTAVAPAPSLSACSTPPATSNKKSIYRLNSRS